jgi:hypothetical protein
MRKREKKNFTLRKKNIYHQSVEERMKMQQPQKGQRNVSSLKQTILTKNKFLPKKAGKYFCK